MSSAGTGTACLDEDQLQAILDGRMSGDAAALAHLEGCEVCSAVLALARDASRAALHAAVAKTEPAPPIARGQAIGRYLILDRVGTGAMGVVYTAYDTELDRRIAIKVLKSTANPVSRQQLRAEAQAMARLTHPNVIRVYDVGEHQRALFIAMELVDGVTLAEWLAERPRSWREVVERFASAAAGLAAAHDAGVVHRDFKPANVLVRRDGHTFVTDFGLARTTAATDAGGAIAGTPRYMAPEVVFGEGATIRSDIFSFAMALHEGLCGRTDATLLEMRSGLAAEERIPDWLRAELFRALDPDPEGRHPSMHVLAEVLTRASDEDAAARCERAGEPAEGVWSAAIRARVQAAFLASGVTSAARVFASVDQAFQRWKETWAGFARELCVDTLHRSQPESLLSRRTTALQRRRLDAQALAEVLGTADAPLVLKALDVVESLRAVDDCGDLSKLSVDTPLPAEALRPEVERVHRELARVEALTKAGRREEALALAERALREAEDIGYIPLIAECQLAAAASYGSGQLDRALELLRAAQCHALSVHDDRTAARALLAAATIQGNRRADFDGAEHGLNLAEALAARIGGDPSLQASLDHVRGQVRYKQGRLDEAIALYRRALEVRRRSGADSITEIIRNNLANALARSGDAEAALAEHQALLEARIARHGPVHPSVGSSYNNIGMTHIEAAHRPASALEAFERALQTNRAVFGPDGPEVALALGNIGFALAELGQHERALAYLEDGLDMLVRHRGPTTMDAVEILAEIAEVQVRRGALQAAAETVERCFGALDASVGRSHPATAVVHAAHGRLLLARGEPRAAEEAFGRALALAERSRPTIVAGLLVGIGSARLEQGAHERAIEVLHRALALQAPPRVTGDGAFALARALRALRPDELGPALERARRAYGEAGPGAEGRREALEAWERARP